MNVETGEIRVFPSKDELQAAIHTGKWVQLGKRPKANCKHCYGRGHIGVNDAGLYVPCGCVKARKMNHV